MKALRHRLFADALVGPGHRLPMTLLRLRVRDLFLQLAAEAYCAGMSNTAAAEWLYQRLSLYRTGGWRRDYFEEACPPRLAGHINGLMWAVLKCSGGRVVKCRTIRRLLSIRGQAVEV